MDIKLASQRGRIAWLGAVLACFGFVSAGFAAPAPSSSSDFELEYFHAYRASKTYAIQLKDGLSAWFDFDAGTASLYDGTTTTTVSLADVLLQANNGDIQAADGMFNQMYQRISALHADAIMASARAGGVSPNFIEPPRGAIGIGDYDIDLWSMPTGRSCWPVPNPCNQWSGGLSNWGMYNQWWGIGFADPPPTSQPPDPDGCDPNDGDCKFWELRRQIACSELIYDGLAVTAFSATMAPCRSAAGATPHGRIACLGAALGYTGATLKTASDTKACRTPYRGRR